MSKLIYKYSYTDDDNNIYSSELLTQMRYYILSNLSDEYPFYYCSISNALYNNFRCCMYQNLKFYGNRYKTVDNSEYYCVYSFVNADGSVDYYLKDNYSTYNILSYSQVNQDLQFTNVSNKETGLIDLVADLKFTSSSNNSDTNIYLFTISAILMLILLISFFRNIFKWRS